MESTKGYVYILINPSYEGLVKIGKTTSYYLNIANYKANFDKFLYPYLCNSKDYKIDKHK